MAVPGNFLSVEYLLGVLREELHDPELPGDGETPDQDSLWSTDYLIRCIHRAQIQTARHTLDIHDVHDVVLTAATEYPYPDYILELRDFPRIVETERYLRVYGLGDALYDRRYGDYDGFPSVTARGLVTFDQRLNKFTLDSAPTGADIGRTLRFFVYRLPKAPIADAGSSLELRGLKYERALLAWAKREAFNKHDSETYDARLRDREEAEFNAAVDELYPEARKRRRHGGVVAYGGL